MDPTQLRIASHPILVTGSIRSGTTWLGRLLATCDNAFYLHEPFNPDSIWNGAFPTPVSHFYIDPSFGGIYRGRFHRLLQLQPRFAGKWMDTIRTRKQRYITNRIKGFDPDRPVTPIVKDPMALYSTEWLVESFDMTPVVLLRHPVSIMKSLLRLGWAEKLQGFVQYGQPLLIERLAALDESFRRYGDKSAWAAETPLHRALNYVEFNCRFIAAMKQAYPEWTFVSYEQLSGDKPSLMALIRGVGLTPTAQTEYIVHEQEDGFDPALAHQESLAPRSPDLSTLFSSDHFCDHWEELYRDHFGFLRERFPELPALHL